MADEKQLKIQASNNIFEMIKFMKDKTGYDEDDIIFLIKAWIKVGETFPHVNRPAKQAGKNYGPFIKTIFVGGNVTPTSAVIPNPPNESNSKEKSSQYLYHRLNELSNHVYVDNGWGYLAFNQAEGAIMRLVWNYRVMLRQRDPELSKQFERRLRTVRP